MRKLFTLFAVIMMAIAVNAQTTSPIYITFAGRGEASTVDEVTVTNVSQPEVEPVTLSGTDILLLADNSEDATAIQNALQQAGLEEPILTPNPSMADGTLIFDAKEAGPVRVSIYTTDGVLVEQETVQAEEGRNTVLVPSQLHGIYIINVVGKGINHSTRWICNGSKSNASIALGGAAQWADETPEFLRKDAVKSTPTNVVILSYTEGDILRFEGTSGKMTSIVNISPESSHDVTFDFYRCEDAAGYNYPIVRLGDMLWMLEDLRPQKMPNLTRTSVPEIWQEINPNDTAVFVQNDKAYYTVNGARKCMPEGWEMPSIDEIYALVNELQADTTKLGDFLKDRSYEEWAKELIEGPDTLHLQLMANGFINPQGVLTKNNVTGAWVTRTTINYGHPATFEINSLDSKLYPLVIHEKCCGFTVRGVRPAPSVYMEMIKEAFPQSEFGNESAGSPKLRRPMQIIEKDGPLGDLYSYGADRKSVFFDYTSLQYGGSTEQRSGLLFKKSGETDWTFGYKNLVPADVNGNDPQRILRKVAAQGNADGYENVVYASWSKPFRAYFDGTTKQAVPEHSSVMGEGVVNITIFGDSARNYAILDDYATRPLLDKDGNEYLWSMPTFNGKEKLLYYNDGKYSDVRSEYFARAFNLKCIQDQTGDGVDEIVMNVSDKIAVFDGVTLRCLRERKFADEGSYIGTANLRYDVADVNGDGYEDIVMVVNTNDVGSLQVYSKGQIDKGPVFIKALSSKSLFCDVKVGNMSGGELPEIAVLTRGVRTNANQMLEQKGCLYVSRLKYNSNLQLTEEVVLSKTEVNAFASNDDLSRHVGNMDLVFGYFRGKDIKDKNGNTITYPQDLIVGDGLWRWDETDKKPTYRFQVLPHTKSDYYTIPADAIAAVQTRENDKELLTFIWNINVPYSLTNDHPAVLSEFGEVWLTGDDWATVNRRLNFASEVFGWGKVGTQIGSTNWTELTKWNNKDNGNEINSHPVLCKFADRERPRYFKYIGHELTFTEPRVYAAIAAAPYYKGLQGSTGAATTWGKVNSVGDSESSSDTFGGSLICGYECSFSAPIFHAETGVDFTMKASASYTKAVETGETKSYGNSYTAGQDHVVIMQATPCDTYTYKIVRSDNPDEMGASFVISQPRTRRFVNLTLGDYVRLTASQRGVARPQWRLYGTPGKPFTYCRKASDFDRDRIISKAYPMMIGRDLNGKESYQMVGTGESTSRSLSTSKDTTTTKTVEVGVEAELVFKNSGAKAGVGFNYNNTDQSIHKVGTEFSVEGTVPGLPSLNDPEHPQFNWNIVWYYVKDAGGIYPVVNYIVIEK